MKAPRLKLENWMALDVADAGVLKRDVVHLLLKHPQGIKLGDFSGAFYKLHGHPPQVALHGYSSLKYLLTDMKNVVVLEKNSLATIIKLAVGTSLDSWLNKEKEMQSLMDEEADPGSPAPFQDTDFPVLDSTPQKMKHESSPREVLALLSDLLKSYKSGLRVKKLQEFLLTLKGFDLEKFSISQGYRDTLEFLEHQMPALKITYRECRRDCVVNQVCRSSATSQAIASLSCDLDCSASTSKTLNQNVLGKEPAPTEVLALVSNLLNTHLSGLRVKKLQEFLLTSKEFDLEKFSIAQGYKDTLEFLEHQMPELKITYRECRHNCVVKQASQRPKTSQASTSPSCDLDSSARKSKTLKQNVLERKKTGKVERVPRLNLVWDLVPHDYVIKRLSSIPVPKALPLSVCSWHKPLSFSASETKPASCSSMTSQAGTSTSSASKSKTLKQDVPRKKAAPAEILALLTNLINTYPSGVGIKELQGFLLRVMGFDLEKFSIAQGYKEALEFLEDQMPELKVEHFKKRLSCVIQQGQDIRKKQKYQGYRKKIAKSPEHSLALLTNILHTESSGMKVKKLQELLLALAGFDLEKFCIAQGYVDTLEFLEHQMPELNINYRGSRLECVVKKGQGKKKVQKKCQGSQETTTKRQGKGKVQKKCQGSHEKMTKNLEEVTNRDLERALDNLTLLELREKECCLRFRSIPQLPDEDIKGRIIKVLADFLGLEEEDMEIEIGKVYRINSRFARTRNVPRDTLVHFVRKKIRDQVWQKHFNTRLKMDNTDIIVLKEIPFTILQKRKEYVFLTEKLKQKKIMFRWDTLEGVIFTFKEQRFRLNSVQKAREFLERFKREF